MFDIGGTELLVIGVVALIVVGPKDLPVLFRRTGEFVGKARGMAREFSSAMNQAAKESGMGDVKKTIETAANPVKAGMNSIKDSASSAMKFDPDSETGKLSAEREEAKKKILEASEKRAKDRLAAEAAAKEAAAAAEKAADAAAPKDEA